MHSAPLIPHDAPVAPGPRNAADLFWSFTWLALQGFGGVVAVVQRELVEKKRWLTLEEFVEDWAAAQVLPGPNVINLSLMIGGRHFGLPGAMVALAGMLAFPILIVLLLAVLFAGVADEPMARGALRGLGAVATGLIAMVWLRLPLYWVLLLVGGTACVLTWRKLAP